MNWIKLKKIKLNKGQKKKQKTHTHTHTQKHKTQNLFNFDGKKIVNKYILAWLQVKKQNSREKKQYGRYLL